MSSGEDDNLFGEDSDDTAELIAAGKKSAPAAAAKKKTSHPVKKKAAPVKKTPDADKDGDDSDGGLFDSDSDDDDSPKKEAAVPRKEALSKRQRLEALAKRKKGPESQKSEFKKPAAKVDGSKEKESGYDSEDSYDSATFERTEEDDNFIDTTGEDADAVNELYAEQNFADERPDREGGKKKKGKKRRMRDGDDGDDDVGRNADLEPDNPVMAAVHRMKKKKRDKKTLTEVEDEIKVFLNRMEIAAEEDEAAVADRRPATKKLSMLTEVCDMLTRRDMQRMLLDFDLLTVCKRWIQPLPSGILGNVTVRQRLLEAISKMTGETGINANDLKRSELGKTVMVLFKHRSETPAMKRQLKDLVEQWSRPIFQKSGNMRDLERIHGSRGADGLAALSRQQQLVARQEERTKQQASGADKQDLNSLIETGKKGGGKTGVNRVRVPFSKGFSYSVRPTARATGTPEKRSGGGGTTVKDSRGNLVKRMVEKGRTVGKNQRSANISVEGRATKG